MKVLNCFYFTLFFSLKAIFCEENIKNVNNKEIRKLQNNNNNNQLSFMLQRVTEQFYRRINGGGGKTTEGMQITLQLEDNFSKENLDLNCSQSNPNIKACQNLANLCVLSIYDQKICSFRTETENRIYDSLYFKKGTEELLKDRVSENEVSFDVESSNKNDKLVSSLDLYIARWDFEGNFYGINKLKNELNICTNTLKDIDTFKSFGKTAINECFFDTIRYKRDFYKKTYFYQLFLKQKSSDSNEGSQYLEIPVLIDNYVNPTLSTANLVQTSMNSKTMHKRFFVVNNMFSNDIILYARNITLKVELINDRESRGKSLIYRPYIKINYEQVAIKEKYESKSENVAFLVADYYMEPDYIMKWILGIFIALLVIVVLIVIFKTYVWSLLNPSNFFQGNNYTLFLAGTFLINLFKYYGLFIFIWSAGISTYWYIFFKMQYRPYILLPSMYENYQTYYKKYYFIWGLGCACYCVYIFYKIHIQVTCHVFFIDWEHEKDILINNMGIGAVKKYKGPWRRLHIANQYNIMQNERTVSISFCFALFIMLWYFFDWEKKAQVFSRYNDSEKSPLSVILRQFISTFIFFIGGIAQYFLVRIIQLWIPMKKTEFVDLCSLANISVFILQDSLRGYYIHGQSPLGLSETNLYNLSRFLEDESKGKMRGRGMTDESGDDLQSYEIYLSQNMRRIYDGLYYSDSYNRIEKGVNDDQIQNNSPFDKYTKYLPKSLDVSNVVNANEFMNNHLKIKIQQVASQSKLFIKDKSLKERFTDYPPYIDLTSENAKELFFYKDPGMNFEKVLFTGMEIEWLIFVIYVFQMWTIGLDKYRDSFPESMFLTFLVEEIFYLIRTFRGEKNVAVKSIIDNRFL